MNIFGFVTDVQKIYRTGAATEHSYRAALQNLLSSINEDVVALNEPKRVKCGAPDFLVNRGEIVIGHIEAKDIDKDLSTLRGTEAEQKERYLKALPNLIYTNCLDFEFYRQGKLLTRISIADFLMGIQPKPDQYATLEHQLKDFAAQRPQTITSSEKLAEIMAGKAVLIKDVLFNALKEDKDLQTELANQYKAFQEHLIHDITREDFADIYAETIAYGMFAARLHDETLETFSRHEALELLPKSNPFLRALFTYIAGPDLDDRIKWIIDDLANVFQAADVRKIMENFGSMTGRNDPFLHFYETFLAKYNPAKRKARGVWYTPEPVVNFIVRAVDEVLKTEFGLPMGLADTSKITIDWDTGQQERTKAGKIAKSGKNATVKKEVHRVQILDPATGTGTFLAEVVKQIAPKVKGIAEGMWSGYIEEDLIPRIHGFELLMASYAMCHMKLDMVLSELGYRPSGTPPRLGVYLTNSLEEGEPANQTLPFAQWLSNEVKQANAVKRDMPIMVAFGNPPYSGISSNMNSWIAKNKIEDYKYVDGVHFGERKHWLNDDYVQFIRLGEHYIEKNGEGMLAYISNRYYVENPTFRGMRWHLLNTFDDIYILDLHGQSGIDAPDGSADVNVFDIEKGVAIIIAIKKKAKVRRTLANVYYHELWGKRNYKYEILNQETLDSINWQKLDTREPFYFFIPKTYKNIAQYNEGFELRKLFPVNATGIVTARDSLVIDTHKEDLKDRILYFTDHRNTDDHVRQTFFGHKKEKKYKKGDTRGWKLDLARNKIRHFNHDSKIKKINYRPFDNCLIYYAQEMVDWGREDVMRHMLDEKNIALVVCRQSISDNWSHVLIANILCDDSYISNKSKERGYVMPLYRYEAVMGDVEQKVPNFAPSIYKKIKDAVPDVTPESLFDYIYAVLHAPDYRERYAEFLKSDFPRIPYPSDPETFHALSKKGAAIRELHLLESPLLDDTGVTYPEAGDNEVQSIGKNSYRDGKVWINEKQYFGSVPETAWEFYVGGYQPAQKWLKDRKGRQLSFDDIMHYQKIIKVLIETDRIMQTIELKLDA